MTKRSSTFFNKRRDTFTVLPPLICMFAIHRRIKGNRTRFSIYTKGIVDNFGIGQYVKSVLANIWMFFCKNIFDVLDESGFYAMLAYFRANNS